jgi:hypothetical protein
MPRFRGPAVQENVSTSPRRALGPIRLASRPAPFVRRRLSRESAQGLEILGHAIEYLADEYAADPADKGPLGNADPRIAAIQTLKSLNRAIYFSGAEVQPVWQRLRKWFLRSTVRNIRSGNGR